MNSRSVVVTVVCLAVGFVAGVVVSYLAFPQVNSKPMLDAQTVALVNGRPIQVERFTSALLQGTTNVDKSQVALDHRQRTLQAMVDARLLAEYAGEENLFGSDALLLSALRNAVASAVVPAPEQPTRAALEAFYAKHGSQFRTPTRVTVQRMVFRGDGAAKAAEFAHAQLESGAEFGSVKAQFASPDLLALPGGMREAAELVGFLGEELAQRVAQMPRGAFTQPVAEAGGYVILGVQDNEPARKPQFDVVRAQLSALYAQHQRASVLEELLETLRANASVQINTTLLEQLAPE